MMIIRLFKSNAMTVDILQCSKFKCYEETSKFFNSQMYASIIWAIIGSDICWLPVRFKTIIWTNDLSFLIWPLWTDLFNYMSRIYNHWVNSYCEL